MTTLPAVNMALIPLKLEQLKKLGRLQSRMEIPHHPSIPVQTLKTITQSISGWRSLGKRPCACNNNISTFMVLLSIFLLIGKQRCIHRNYSCYFVVFQRSILHGNFGKFLVHLSINSRRKNCFCASETRNMVKILYFLSRHIVQKRPVG